MSCEPRRPPAHGTGGTGAPARDVRQARYAMQYVREVGDPWEQCRVVQLLLAALDTITQGHRAVGRPRSSDRATTLGSQGLGSGVREPSGPHRDEALPRLQDTRTIYQNITTRRKRWSGHSMEAGCSWA